MAERDSPEQSLGAAGVVDVNPKPHGPQGEQRGIPADANSKEALNHKETFDTVLVIVPPEHHAVVIAAVEAGLHTLIEKPLAHHLEDGIRIIEAAETSGKQAIVSQNHRFKRAARTGRQFQIRRHDEPEIHKRKAPKNVGNQRSCR